MTFPGHGAGAPPPLRAPKEEDEDYLNHEKNPAETTGKPEVAEEKSIRDEEWERKWANFSEDNVDDEDDEELYLDYIKSLAAKPEQQQTEAEQSQQAETASKQTEMEKEPELHKQAESEIKQQVEMESEIKQEMEPEIKQEMEPEIKQEMEPEIKQQAETKTVNEEEEDEDVETNGMMDRLLSAVTEGYYFWKD